MAAGAGYNPRPMTFDAKVALDALRKVMDPELRRDLVSLNMV
jgi:metal-sulfur cluster biosynthetic enzyme